MTDIIKVAIRKISVCLFSHSNHSLTMLAETGKVAYVTEEQHYHGFNCSSSHPTLPLIGCRCWLGWLGWLGLGTRSGIFWCFDSSKAKTVSTN